MAQVKMNFFIIFIHISAKKSRIRSADMLLAYFIGILFSCNPIFFCKNTKCVFYQDNASINALTKILCDTLILLDDYYLNVNLLKKCMALQSFCAAKIDVDTAITLLYALRESVSKMSFSC